MTMLLVIPMAHGQLEEGNVDNLPIHEYTLTIEEQKVNKAGKEVMGVIINSNIPWPTLDFIEGEYAFINVTNNMEVETVRIPRLFG